MIPHALYLPLLRDAVRFFVCDDRGRNERTYSFTPPLNVFQSSLALVAALLATSRTESDIFDDVLDVSDGIRISP